MFKYGDNEAYWSARLARDHPDLKARVDGGEFGSARIAAHATGIARREFRCPYDPATAAKRIVKYFPGDSLDALLAEIARLRG
jgi:hypothetical protein